MLRLCVEAFQDQADIKQAAMGRVDALCAKYDGNFDILDNIDDVDNFIDDFIQQFDDTMIRETHPDYALIAGAGAIMRYETGVYHVGVDEDAPPAFDLVPDFDGVEDFCFAISTVIQKKKTIGFFPFPTMTYALTQGCKAHRSNAVEPLAKSLVARRSSILIDPPFAIANYATKKGIVFLTREELDVRLQRYANRDLTLIFFGGDETIWRQYADCQVMNFAYCPFYPVSAKYTQEVKFDRVATRWKGRAYINRRTYGFSYCASDGNFSYHPPQWAQLLGMKISEIAIEWMTRRLFSNFDMKCAPTRYPRYFPYVVAACQLKTVRGKTEIIEYKKPYLEYGLFYNRDGQPVVVSKPLKLEPVALISVQPLSGVFSMVTLDHRGAVETIRTKLGWPMHSNYYMKQGEYYKVVPGVGEGYLVNVMVATCYANINSSIVSCMVNVKLADLARVYHSDALNAYYQHIMAFEASYPVEEDHVGTSYVLQQMQFEPAKF